MRSLLSKLGPLLALGLALSACGINSGSGGTSGMRGSGGLGNDGAGGSGGNAQKQVNETDTSVCGQGAPAYRLDGNRWQMKFRQGDFRFAMVFDFNDGELTLSNHCSFKGRDLTATVSSPILDNGRSITVLADANHTEEMTDGGFHFDCRVSLARSRVSYEFKGSCLQLREEGNPDVLTLVPARF